ncbi:hypothetical protein [Grimontia hollisae]|uniref:hypothetical protein n=1 Tax=Grimontia hollisae TaxID=673 RepID=UPI00165DF990|nr:hypothetical protein [Grimontia hollisae]
MTSVKKIATYIALLSFTFESQAKWSEADYVTHYCDGKIEHLLPDSTRIDCLTETHAIEYDFGHKWAEAIGQSIYYSSQTGKKAGIVLIVDEQTKDRYLARLTAAIDAAELDIDVETILTKQKVKD